MRQSFKKNWFLISMLLLAFVLRLPSLFEPYWYGDEGISLTVGLGIKRGLLLYRDIYDNRPPLLYLLTALAGNLFWLRFFLLAFSLGSVVFMEKITKIIIEKNELANKLAVIFFVVFLNTPFIEGNIAHPEVLQILPTLMAIWFVFKKGSLKGSDYFLSGLLFCFSMMLKIPAVFDLATVLIFLLLFLGRGKEPKFRKKISFFCLGLALPFFTSLVFFSYQHYLKGFYQATFLENIGYLSSWKTGFHKISILESGLIPKGLFLVILVSFLYLKRNKFSPNNIFLALWLGFSLTAASLSGRPYAHYLVQTLPPISLIVGKIMANKNFSSKLALLLTLLLIYLIILTNPLKKRFSTYGVLPYYQNFWGFFLGRKNKEAYFSYFDPQVSATYQVAKFISASTKPDEKIFIWADAPQIYALAKRLPSGRYTTAYHILSHNQEKEIVLELEKDRPKIIILDTQKKTIPPELENLLETRYSSFKKIGDFEVYNLVQRI